MTHANIMDGTASAIAQRLTEGTASSGKLSRVVITLFGGGANADKPAFA